MSLTRSARDIRIALDSPELYVLLVQNRGWSPQMWQSWVTETHCQQLLRQPRAPQRE